jgi:hypothetical protein
MMMPSAEFEPFSHYEAQTLVKAYHRQYNDAPIKLCISLFIFLPLYRFCFGTYRNWPYKIESDENYYNQYLVSAFMDKYRGFTNNHNVDR